MEWTEEEGVSYNITIFPMVPITFTESTSVQLIVSYNTEYNVNLEAVTVCQSVAPSRIQLFYGEFSNFKLAYWYIHITLGCTYSMRYNYLLQFIVDIFSCQLLTIINQM